MLVIFLPLVAVYMAYRLLRQKLDPRKAEDARHLQLLEVRRLQQESYGRTSYDDYDSDSSSVEGADDADEEKDGIALNESDSTAAPAETPQEPDQPEQ